MIAALILVSTISIIQPPSVVGTWKLVSYWTETADGKRTFPLGDDAVGLAVYTANGHVSIQFERRERPKFTSGDAWRGTLEEERAAFEGYFAYAGRYTIDAVKSAVTHHIEVCSAPNYVGTDLVRTFSFSGRQLTLKTPPRQLAGQVSSSTLIWERVN